MSQRSLSHTHTHHNLTHTHTHAPHPHRNRRERAGIWWSCPRGKISHPHPATQAQETTKSPHQPNPRWRSRGDVPSSRFGQPRMHVLLLGCPRGSWAGRDSNPPGVLRTWTGKSALPSFANPFLTPLSLLAPHQVSTLAGVGGDAGF